MYLQQRKSVFDLVWVDGITYGDVFIKTKSSMSKYNFEKSDANWLLSQFNDYESQAKRLIEAGLPLPGYEMCAQMLAHFQPARRSGWRSRSRARGVHLTRALASENRRAGYFESREKLGFRC